MMRAKTRAAALLLVVLLPTGAAAGADDLAVVASTYRVDLGALEPGAERSGTFALINPGYDPVAVHLLPEGRPSYLRVPDRVDVPGGSSVDVRYHYRVPADAPPGNHGEALKLAPRPADAVPGIGTMFAGPAIVFTSRTAAIGVSAIEVPPALLPGARVEGALILVNTWNASANVTLELTWLDPSGAPLDRTLLGPLGIASNATARVAYAFAERVAPSGAHALVARVEDAPADAPLAGALTQTFHLGRREATYAILGVEDLRTGHAEVRYVGENSGDVPVRLALTLLVRDGAGATRNVPLDAVTLAPGERRAMSVVVALPPGRFAFLLESDDDSLRLLSQHAAPDTLVMRAPAPERPDVLVLAFAGLGAAILLAALVVLWRRRDALRASFARVASRLRPRRDPYDALLGSLEREERAERPAPPRADPAPGRAALFVHLDGFGNDRVQLAQLAALSGGRTIEAAYVYARAGDEKTAAQLRAEIAALGFTPRVAPAAADLRVEAVVDAMREANAGRAILLATHDRAYEPLVHALREDGAEVVALGLPRELVLRPLQARLPAPKR